MPRPSLFGLATTIPVTSHVVALRVAPSPNSHLKRLYVTINISPSTSRQFDYYMNSGNARDLAVRIAARAVASGVMSGIGGQYITEESWDNYVVVRYVGQTASCGRVALTVTVYCDPSPVHLVPSIYGV